MHMGWQMPQPDCEVDIEDFHLHCCPQAPAEPFQCFLHLNAGVQPMSTWNRDVQPCLCQTGPSSKVSVNDSNLKTLGF